ncbi:MAG: hypothetical protein H7249_03250 [Chitinophagaceae bacterium]|nr:hypothetical protein [Oligoflexus sp.]
MQVLKPLTLAGLLTAVVLPSAFANDGRDRARQSMPTQLELFAPPISEDSGYRFLEKDGPGGVDGTEMFRWVRPIGESLVRIAAFETTKTLGHAAYPMAIFDLTSENGDTPVDMDPSHPPRGRHPGGSHDSGLNMDLGYYLTSVKGKDFNPDLAACSDHFKAPKPGSQSLEEANQCLGVADKLSVTHEAYFLLEVAKINRHSFGGDLIEEIGIDWQARVRVVKQLEEWVKSGRYGVTAELTDDLTHSFTSDAWDGWATAHLHHIHLRMQDIPMTGHSRKALDALMDREKAIDRGLMAKLNPSAPHPLWLRLLSSGLSRSIEAEILSLDPKADVRFQSDSLEWTKADVSRAPHASATWDLPDGFHDERSLASVKAEFKENGKTVTRNGLLPLPRKPSYLSIAVDPAQIKGYLESTRGGQELTLKLDYPEPYRAYITKVSYALTYANQDPVPSLAESTKTDNFPANVPFDKKNPVQSVTAHVVLSSRLTLKIPIYFLPMWNTKF